jgi:4-amino-4-deoxy-L-arabinose transferase-like glycosyltransferase
MRDAFFLARRSPCPDYDRLVAVPSALRRERVLVLLSVLAVAHGLLYAPATRRVTHDSVTYIAAAQALEHGSYSTPLAAQAFPATGGSEHPGATVDLTDHVLPEGALDDQEDQAWRSPSYPVLVALLGGGGSALSRGLVVLVQALLFGVATFLVGATARRLWGTNAGVLAAALVAVDPFTKRYVSLVLSETLALVLCAALAYGVVRAWDGARSRVWLSIGAAGGLLVLTRPGMLPLPLVAAAVAVLLPGDRLRRTAAVLGAFLVFVVPWLAWTSYATGSPTLAAYGEGVNLLVGARGQSSSRAPSSVAVSKQFLADVHALHVRFPSTAALRSDPTAHPHYLAAYDAALRNRAWHVYAQRLRDEPRTVVGEIADRAQFVWSAHHDWYQPGGGPLQRVLVLADWATILLALAGIALAWRPSPASRPIAAALLLFTAIISFHQVEARFTIPLRPLELMFVAYALLRLLGLVRRRRGGTLVAS